MHKLFLTLAVAAITLTSCGSKATDSQTDNNVIECDSTELVMPADIHPTAGLVQKLLDENALIDIDYPTLANQINEARFDTTKITPAFTDKVAHFNAAIYRLASHTKVAGDAYVYDGTPAKDLNVSEAILQEWLKNLDDNNAGFKKWREQGLDFEVPEFDQEFFDSLLN